MESSDFVGYKSAIYPGYFYNFDEMGIDVIRQSLKVFDKIVLLVLAQDPRIRLPVLQKIIDRVYGIARNSLAPDEFRKISVLGIQERRDVDRFLREAHISGMIRKFHRVESELKLEVEAEISRINYEDYHLQTIFVIPSYKYLQLPHDGESQKKSEGYRRGVTSMLKAKYPIDPLYQRILSREEFERLIERKSVSILEILGEETRELDANIAFYAGSFDPLTNGHLEAIRQASHIYKVIIVGIGVHPNKIPMYSPEVRKQLIEESLISTGIKDVKVVIYDSTMPTVRVAARLGAGTLLRGARNVKDIKDELILAWINQMLNQKMRTVLITPHEYEDVSSTKLREEFHAGRDISRLAPGPVFSEMMKARFAEIKKTTRIIGLVGGIASGKTTILNEFEKDKDTEVINLDKLGHKALEKEEVINKLAKLFGKGILAGDKIDRAKLRDIAFENDKKRFLLTSIVNTHIFRETERFIAAAREHNPRVRLIVLEGIGMVEAGMHRFMDEIWLADAPEEMRIQRALSDETRVALERRKVWEIIERQRSILELSREKADVIFDNSKDLDHLRDQISKRAAIAYLRYQWNQILGKANVLDEGGRVFTRIIEKYMQPHRYYHNVLHIAAIFRILDELIESGELDALFAAVAEEEVVAFKLAMFLHDVIYNAAPEGQDEDQSIEFAEEVLTEIGFLTTIINRTKHLINLTKIHQVDSRDLLAQIFIDLDLSILGAETEVFDRYDRNIRKEYSRYDINAYLFGRSAVLHSIKDAGREQIFHNSVFKRKYEQKAQENLERTVKVYEQWFTRYKALRGEWRQFLQRFNIEDVNDQKFNDFFEKSIISKKTNAASSPATRIGEASSATKLGETSRSSLRSSSPVGGPQPEGGVTDALESERREVNEWRARQQRAAEDRGAVFDPYLCAGDFIALLFFIEKRGYFFFDASDTGALFSALAKARTRKDFEAGVDRLVALTRLFVLAVDRLEARLLHLAPILSHDKIILVYKQNFDQLRFWREEEAAGGIQLFMNLAFWLKMGPFSMKEELEEEAARFLAEALSRYPGTQYLKRPSFPMTAYPAGFRELIGDMRYDAEIQKICFELLGDRAYLRVLSRDMQGAVAVFEHENDVYPLFVLFSLFQAVETLREVKEFGDEAVRDIIREMRLYWDEMFWDVSAEMALEISSFFANPQPNAAGNIVFAFGLAARIKEYFLKTELRLAGEGQEGQARSSSPVGGSDFVERAARELRSYERFLKGLGPAVSIFGSKEIKSDNPYYREAMELARSLAHEGYAVVTGGGPGIMEAANRGVPPGKISVGLRIELPFNEAANPFVNLPLVFQYFFTRKMAFIHLSRAFICMPGGFGTLDEFFEILALKDRGYAANLPLILFGWDGLMGLLKEIERRGLFRRRIDDMVVLVDSKEEVLRYLRHTGAVRQKANGLRTIEAGRMIRTLQKTMARLEGLEPAVGIVGSQTVPRGSREYELGKNISAKLFDLGISLLYPGGDAGVPQAAWEGSRMAQRINKKISAESVGLLLSASRRSFRPSADVRLGFTHMFEQKIALLRHSDSGFVFLPGGSGTHDILFEVLCHIQTKKIEARPIILVGSDFWQLWHEWFENVLVPSGVISSKDTRLYTIVDTPQEAVGIIEDFYLRKLVDGGGRASSGSSSPLYSRAGVPEKGGVFIGRDTPFFYTRRDAFSLAERQMRHSFDEYLRQERMRRFFLPSAEAGLNPPAENMKEGRSPTGFAEEWLRFFTNKLDPQTPGHDKYMALFKQKFHKAKEGSDWHVFLQEIKKDKNSPWQIVLREMEKDEAKAGNALKGISVIAAMIAVIAFVMPAYGSQKEQVAQAQSANQSNLDMSFKNLLEDLQSNDDLTRMAAAEKLSQYSQEEQIKAIPYLMPMLVHEDWYDGVRLEAAKALGRIGGKEALLAIEQVLEKETYGPGREAAFRALRYMGKEAMPIFSSIVLKREDYQAMFHIVIREIGEIRPLNKTQILILREHFDDSYYLVREAARKALWRIDNEPKTDQQKAEYYLAYQDYNSLVEMGDAAVPTLLKELESQEPQDRMRAAGTLGEIANENSVISLIVLLNDPDDDVRRAVAEALIKMKGMAIPQMLTDLKNGNVPLRQSIIGLLKGMEWEPENKQQMLQFYIAKRDMNEPIEFDDEVIRILIEEFPGPSYSSEFAVNVLAKIGTHAIDELIASLRSPDESIRRHSAVTLGLIGDVRAFYPLTLRLEDPSWLCREAAKEAIAEIEKKQIIAYRPESSAGKSDLKGVGKASLMPIRSEFKNDDDGWWLYADGEKVLPSFGIVYQPVPKGKHINDYKDHLADLYIHLLDKFEGGSDHAKKFYHMGIRSIRAYELTAVNQNDIKALKAIFRRVYEQYGIRVLVGHYAGLYDKVDFTDPQKTKQLTENILKYINVYNQEPWVLGWQIGNENNYYVENALFNKRINLSVSDYYSFMDALALEVKEALASKHLTQIVVLGNGDLSLGEMPLLIKLKNFDAVGLNIYRNREGFYELMDRIEADLKIPVILSEYGYAASNEKEAEQAQADYYQDVSYVIYQNMKRKDVLSRVVLAYIAEATDQQWKAIDLDDKKQGQLGILGKKAEIALGLTLSEIHRANRYIDFFSLSSSDLNEAAWAAIESGNFEKALAFAEKNIRIYQELAKKHQKKLETSGNVSQDNHGKYWALNDVGASHFIRIRVFYEIGRKPEAEYIYQQFLKDYSYAQLQDRQGQYWMIASAVKKLFPDLFPRYIFKNTQEIIIAAILTTLLIPLRSFIKKTGALLKSAKQRKINALKNNSSTFKVQPESALTALDRITLLGLVAALSYCVFDFMGWWFHPARMEFYIVNTTLFWILSYVGLTFAIYNYFIWYILWSMKKPKFVPPENNLKAALVTTFVESEPISLAKETLIKLKSVTYTHDTYILDESNNSELAEFCRANGIIHFSRKNLVQYQKESPPFQTKTKGGNLNAWLDRYGNKYEYVTFFDLDHQPEPHYLSRVLGYFRDHKVAFVQAPQIYKNKEESWIARGSVEQNSYFVGPIQMGYYGNDVALVNGSHSTFRIKALQDMGGYAVHNADDVLLSAKLYARSWKGVYVPEILAYGLTPPSWKANLLQQYRWSHSICDLTFFKFPKLFKKLKPRQMLAYLLMFGYYLQYINMVILFIIPIISIALNQALVNVDLDAFLSRFFVIYGLQLLILIGWGQKFLLRPHLERGIWWRSGFVEIAGTIFVFRALFRALLKRGLLRTKFVTPKEGIKYVSDIGFFKMHIIISIFALITFLYAYSFDEVFWQTEGVRLFLLVEAAVLLGLTLSSTKIFYSISTFLIRFLEKLRLR